MEFREPEAVVGMWIQAGVSNYATLKNIDIKCA
jgi:hypothetical protein